MTMKYYVGLQSKRNLEYFMYISKSSEPIECYATFQIAELSILKLRKT